MSYEMAKAVDQLFSQDPADEVAGSEKKGVSFVKSRSEVVGFPKGWYREELIKSGSGVVNPGHKIVHYYSPDGKKFRSKADLTRFFGHRLDLSNFDFKSGKILPGYTNANQKKYVNTTKFGVQKGLSGSVNGLGCVSLQRFLDPPVRQCTCIYNQKVRAIETCGPNVCKDIKDIPRASSVRNLKPKPVQVFWAKRLEGVSARDVEEGTINMSQLPRGFRAGSSMLTDSAAVTSLTSSIFTASTQGNAGPEPAPVFGQGEKFAKNSAFVNPYQPLIAHVKVTPELIEEQELQVQRLRRDLARLMGRPQKERI